MDGTGVDTSAGPADVTGNAGDVPAGPTGRADATGPLPVTGAPTDPTGPIPTPQADSWFAAGPADTTAAQPAVGAAATPSPSSWFETGPLPVVPPASSGPDAPSWSDVDTPTAPPAASSSLFDAPPTRPDAGGAAPPVLPPVSAGNPRPASLFEPANAQRSTGPADGPPPTGVFPAVGPYPAGVMGGGPAAEPPPPTGILPAVGPQPAGVAGAPPPMGTLPAVGPHPAEIAGGGRQAEPPPTTLFPAIGPQPTAAAPPAGATFAAIGVQIYGHPQAAPTGGFPPAPAPLDATGPIPAIGVPEATTGEAEAPWSAGVETPPHTDAWAFDPDPARPPRTGSWSFASDDRPSADAQALPAPAGRTHSGTTTTPPGTLVKRRTWPLTLAGVVVAVAAGIALVFSLAGTDPAGLAATAATDAGSWPGARYQGAIAATDGGQIQFDLTVTADGASGTLSRDGGRATAELLWDPSGAVMRANREWWLYHHPTRADDLANSWVADPLTETQEIGQVLRLHPAALAEHVRGESPRQWAALEQQLVDGRAGIVLFDGARRVVVGSDDPHPLLAVDVTAGSTTAPVQVSRPADEEAAAVVGAAARIRQEAAPRTLTQLLLERPKVEIQLQPEPLCTAQNCNVTVVVTNSGTAPARGRLEISADGKIVVNHPLDVHPGQVATFTAAAPNPQFAQPGATGRILWEARAVDD
jgi:hypothetical protein